VAVAFSARARSAALSSAARSVTGRPGLRLRSGARGFRLVGRRILSDDCPGIAWKPVTDAQGHIDRARILHKIVQDRRRELLRVHSAASKNGGLRQPRDVDGDPPRFVLRQHLGLQRFGFVVSGIDVRERLPVGVADDITAGARRRRRCRQLTRPVPAFGPRMVRTLCGTVGTELADAT
jgi:hypothetical protein